MNYRKLILAVCMLVAFGAVSLAYGFAGYWAGSAAALGLGFLGYYGYFNLRAAWINDLFLGGTVFLVAIGGLLDLSVYLLLLALIGALGTWDLIRFENRIGRAPDNEDILDIEKRHLILLGLALVGGMLFAGIMLNARIQVSFYIALVFAVILIISLGQIVRVLRS